MSLLHTDSSDSSDIYLREKTCCFSGHRHIPKELVFAMNMRLRDCVQWLYDQGYRCFITGGADGFDMFAALEVLRRRCQYPDIQLHLALPYPKKSPSSYYTRILSIADHVVYLSDTYSTSALMQRNRYMVDHSSLCICWLARSSGGTAYTVEYAKKHALTIYNLYPSNPSAEARFGDL